MKDDVCNMLLNFFMLNPGGTAYVSPRTLEVLESETAVVKGNKNVTFRADDTLNYGTLVFLDKDGKETFTYEMPLCDTGEVKENEPKFTPGPWFVVDCREIDCCNTDYEVSDNDGGLVAMICNDHLDIEAANAALIATSPALYDSEYLNLEIIKSALAGYEDMAKLILSDKDVQEAIKDEAVLREHPEFNPVNINAMLNELRTRIKETEDILALARGEEVK